MRVYATRRDVYDFGLPRGTLGSPARLVASSRAATDTLELEDHGFETGDRLLLRAVDGGTLSSPLVAGVVYFAIRVSDATFKISATDGGPPIDLTSDGASMLVATELPFDRILEYYSRFVEDCVPAHCVPFEHDGDGAYPTVITATVAELAAKKLQTLSGTSSVSVTEAEVAAKEVLKRWGQGIPLRDARATAPSNCAVTSTTRTAGDPRGWGSRFLP